MDLETSESIPAPTPIRSVPQMEKSLATEEGGSVQDEDVEAGQFHMFRYMRACIIF